MTTHNPITPGWTCAGCGADWPCRTRRGELLAEYDGALVSLSVHLGRCLVAAAPDLATVAAGPLYERFIGWARENPPPSAVEVLAYSRDQALRHVADPGGRCRACGDASPCWVASDAVARLALAKWPIPLGAVAPPPGRPETTTLVGDAMPDLVHVVDR